MFINHVIVKMILLRLCKSSLYLNNTHKVLGFLEFNNKLCVQLCVRCIKINT